MNKKIDKYILRIGEKVLGIPWNCIEENLLTPEEYQHFLGFIAGKRVGEKFGIAFVYLEDFEKFLNYYENKE